MPPTKQMFSGVFCNQPVCPSICVSICVQNASFCQSAGRGIRSHLVTALVPFKVIDRNRSFLCPCIDRPGAYSVWPVRFSGKTFTLAIAFEWYVIELSYFTYIFLGLIPFFFVAKSKSSVKVKVKYQGHSFQKNGH